jgi:mannan polymerase II complex MNN11 subunit
MQFAYPPRKASNPPVYAHRKSHTTWLRRSRARTLAIGAGILFSLWFILSRLTGGSQHVQVGEPTEAVVVTVLQPGLYSEEYIENIRQNRIQYARRRGKLYPPRGDEGC